MKSTDTKTNVEKEVKSAPETAKKETVKKEAKTKEAKAVNGAVKKEIEAKTKAKASAKKAGAAVKTKLIFQHYGTEYDPDAIAKKAQKAAAKKTVKLKKLEVYVNIEENAAYYVVNGEAKDEYKIEL